MSELPLDVMYDDPSAEEREVMEGARPAATRLASFATAQAGIEASEENARLIVALLQVGMVSALREARRRGLLVGAAAGPAPGGGEDGPARDDDYGREAGA